MTAALPTDAIRGIITVIPCTDLSAMLAYFRETLGFRIELISPADSPTTVVMWGHGAQVRLQKVDVAFEPGVLQLICDDPHVFGDAELVAPNGTRIELVPSNPPIAIPPLQQSIVVSTLRGNAQFGGGRAGMQYRDLVPDRQGGRFIASNILIAEGGPVPDYVHFHKVRFQMIYVYRGWVRVIYEDQGESFVMQAGDCVLQPPTIRHRVLEASPGMQVIEVGCPADHDTIAEHTITLPTGRELPNREYGGQLFVRHQAHLSPWRAFRYDGFTFQDLGIGSATDGLAGARVIRAEGGTQWPRSILDNEFLFTFLLDGTAVLEIDGREAQSIEAGDSFVIPTDVAYSLSEVSSDAKLLEVSLPADLTPQRV